MPETKLPTAVPLPEVPHFTDEVIFGALHLPVGFDQSRLQVNVRAFERIRRTSGLGTVSIVAAMSESEPFDVSVSQVNASGEATAGVMGKRKKKPLAAGVVQYENPSASLFERPATVLRLDNTEIEQRIEESNKYKKGVFDEGAQAKFLNKAIKEGLNEANLKANFDMSKFKVGVGIYAAYGILLPVYPVALAVPFIAGPSTNLLMATMESTRASMRGEDGRQAFKNYKQSFFAGCTVDRYVAAQGLIAASRLIKVQK